MEAPQTLSRADDSEFELDPERLLVALERSMGRDEISEIVDDFDLRLEDDEEAAAAEDQLPASGVQVNHSDTRYWVRGDGPVPDDVIADLEAHDDVDWVAPVYRRAGETGREAYLAPRPDVVLVKYHEQTEANAPALAAATEQLEDMFGLTEDEAESEHLGPFHYFRLSGDGDRETAAYVLSDELLAEKGDEIAEVHLESQPLVSPLTAVPQSAAVPQPTAEAAVAEESVAVVEEPIVHTPDDPDFTDQWDMTQIRAPEAWNLNTGSRRVKIGVLDTGCDLDHEDLTFDGPGYNAGTETNDGSAVGNHGTAVAGIAAATIDNGLGVAGVSGECEVHSVAIPNWTEVEVARAINEAANVAGVDVINMSFGWWYWDEAIIDPAIENAHDNRNVVLCAATGNENNDVIRYPATHPKTITVGGSDQNDERKRPSSPDGETWWGASYGPTIDVVAPAVLCPTTDRGGGAGYSSTDYFDRFNGTSAATPHVAGLAALIRSFDPTLNNVEIRRAIERTCDKVSWSTYSYTWNANKPNGLWHEEMGYGRINAYRALRLASFTERRRTGTHFGGTLDPNETRYQWVGPWHQLYTVDYSVRPTTQSGWITAEIDATYRTSGGIYYRLRMENHRSTATNFEARYMIDW